MIVPAPTPDKKRKLSTDTERREREEGVKKLAKFESIKQASDPVVPTEEKPVKPTSSGLARPNSAMISMKDVAKLLSPSKAIMQEGGEKGASQVPEISQQVLTETLGGIQSLLGKLLEGQERAEKSHADLKGEMHGAISEVKSDIKDVSDRVKTLEECGQIAQVPVAITTEDRHEMDLLAKIEHSRRCVTVVGSGRDTMSIKEIEILIQTSKLAERDEFEVLSVSRLGGIRTITPAFRVELASTVMATSLIENSRVRNARTADQSIRCTVHYPFEYSGRAREMKGSQAVAFRAGLHSQIYFEGTEMCLKVKERDSNLWMIYPSEFGKFKPEMVMSAIRQDGDSAEVTAARVSLLAKLGVTENQGKLLPAELSARSLLFSSRSGNLTKEDFAVKLPHITEGQVTDLQVVKPSSEVQGEYQTRLVFKDRVDAKEALETSIKGFKNKPLAKGDFLNLELLWAS